MKFTLHHSRCEDLFPSLAAKSVDVVLTDPPYSRHVHDKARTSKLPDADTFPCRMNRKHEIGFDALTPELRDICAATFARVAKRWVGVFCNVEMVSDWIASLEGAGLEYVRTCAWVRVGGTPQFTGDRPAAGFEAIVLAHPMSEPNKNGRRKPLKKRWNGGGKSGVYVHLTAIDRCGQGHVERVHTTQKPLGLMLDLVDDFTDEGELIFDPFAGSATTGVAALRRGRRFLGCEASEAAFKSGDERLTAETLETSARSLRDGQQALFGGKTP